MLTLSHSVFLALLQSQGQNLQRRKFPKTKTTCHPGKKLKKKKNRRGSAPEEKTTLQSRRLEENNFEGR